MRQLFDGDNQRPISARSADFCMTIELKRARYSQGIFLLQEWLCCEILLLNGENLMHAESTHKNGSQITDIYVQLHSIPELVYGKDSCTPELMLEDASAFCI
jgi:hypothetical protein